MKLSKKSVLAAICASILLSCGSFGLAADDTNAKCSIEQTDLSVLTVKVKSDKSSFSVMVFPKGKTYTDLLKAPEWSADIVAYAREFKNDGTTEFKMDLSNTRSGDYTLYLSEGGEVSQYDFKFVRKDTKGEVYTIINAATSVDEITDILDYAYLDLGLTDDEWNAVDKSGISSKLWDIKQSGFTFSTDDNGKSDEYLFSAIVIDLLNKSKLTNIFDYTENLNMADTEMKNRYKKDSVTSQTQADVTERMSAKSIIDYNDLITKFKDAVILGVVAGADNYIPVKEVITEFSDYIGVQTSRLSDSAYSAIQGNSFNTIAALADDLKLRYGALNSGNGTGGSGGSTAVQKMYSADTWYNIECVYSISNNEFKIYVDGKYIGTKSDVGFSGGIKGFSIKATSEADSEVYLNNLRVSEYESGGMTVKSAVVSEDNSSIDVEFSGAVSKDEDLSALSVTDENGDLIPIGNIERISAARYRVELYEPLKSNHMYTVFVGGVIKGGADTVCSKDELCIYSNPTGYLPTVTAIYSRDDNIRTATNRFSLTDGIITEFSRPLGDNLNLDNCISLNRGDAAIEKTVELSDDKKSVIITPYAPLDEGEEYVLSLSGLESCDGIPFDDKSLKFIAQSGYTKTADSTVNASEFSVSGDYASGSVTIKGKTDVPNDTVTIMAIKPDSTEYNKDTIAAIREVACGDGGEFEFSFATDKVAGEYKIFVNSLSAKNKTEKGFVFRNFLPEIQVSRNGAAVTKMADLKTGDDIDVYVGGFNMTADFGGYVMLAQYGGGVLKDIQCVDASRNSTYVGSEVNLNVKVADGVERIKVMYLKKPSNAPVFAAYDIK